MRKAITLSLLSSLVLFGCGGGGGGSSTSSTPTVPGGGTAADLGNIVIEFSPPTGAALVDVNAVGLSDDFYHQRNAVRLVASTKESVQTTCKTGQTITCDFYDEDLDEVYPITVCNDPFQYCAVDSFGDPIGPLPVPPNTNCTDTVPPIDGTTCDPQFGPNPNAYNYEDVFTTVGVSDSELEGGFGQAYIAVPPTTGDLKYVLHVLTYQAGNYDGTTYVERDLGTPTDTVGIAAERNSRIPMGVNDVNLLLQYAHSAEFTIAAGTVNDTIAVQYEPIAATNYSTPVLSGDWYDVNIYKTPAGAAATRDLWYLLADLEPPVPAAPHDNPMYNWLIFRSGDVFEGTDPDNIDQKYFVQSTGSSARVYTDMIPALGQGDYTLYNFTQVFINSSMLASGENWTQWIHGINNNNGILQAWGEQPVLVNCGDGALNTGEACDDGMDNSDTAVTVIDGTESTCRLNCTLPGCGDGIVDTALSETCDGDSTAVIPTGGQTADCDADCTAPACGDNVLNQLAGEGCDVVPGGTTTAFDDNPSATPGNLCRSDTSLRPCQFGGCGDGIIDPTTGAVEECDDANADNTDACLNICISASCGDGFVEAGSAEECDGGSIINRVATPADTAACNVDCTSAVCGDLYVNAAAGETCDEGGVDTATCNADCTDAACGDGILNTAAGEACDDGNIISGDGCNTLCQIEGCGDGVLQAGEQCDNGTGGPNPNTDTDPDPDANPATATCTLSCTILSATCGDGTVDAGEVCDDGDTLNTGACLANCSALNTCGDGYVNAAAEDCDGGGVDTVLCNADCTDAVCGDGILNFAAGEQCDDGFTVSGDGCSDTCQLENCGNGVVDVYEVCDDNGAGVTCTLDCLNTIP